MKTLCEDGLIWFRLDRRWLSGLHLPSSLHTTKLDHVLSHDFTWCWTEGHVSSNQPHGLINSICDWVCRHTSNFCAISAISGTSLPVSSNTSWIHLPTMKEGYWHAPCGEHLLGLALGEHGIHLDWCSFLCFWPVQPLGIRAIKTGYTGWVTASSAEPLWASAWLSWDSSIVSSNFFSEQRGQLHGLLKLQTFAKIINQAPSAEWPILRLFYVRRSLLWSSHHWGRRLEGRPTVDWFKKVFDNQPAITDLFHLHRHW